MAANDLVGSYVHVEYGVIVCLFLYVPGSGILISDLRCHRPTFRATESRHGNLTGNAKNI